MKRLWTNDDLVAQWTLQPNELALVEYKEGANRLGFALLLKYFQIDGRFPRQKHDVPAHDAGRAAGIDLPFQQ
jgi:hypothetical protein